MAKEINHTDLLGRPLAEGDVVATCHHNMLQVCTITKLHPRQLRVHEIGANARKNLRTGEAVGMLKYPSQVVKVDGPDATLYILTKS